MASAKLFQLLEQYAAGAWPFASMRISSVRPFGVTWKFLLTWRSASYVPSTWVLTAHYNLCMTRSRKSGKNNQATECTSHSNCLVTSHAPFERAHRILKVNDASIDSVMVSTWPACRLKLQLMTPLRSWFNHFDLVEQHGYIFSVYSRLCIKTVDKAAFCCYINAALQLIFPSTGGACAC